MLTGFFFCTPNHRGHRLGIGLFGQQHKLIDMSLCVSDPPKGVEALFEACRTEHTHQPVKVTQH